MKRFAIHTLLFLLTASVAVGVMIVLFGSTGWLPNVLYRSMHSDFSYTRLREADTTRGVDVMFLGSSHAYRSFDPRSYEAAGLRVFNLGSSCQTPVQGEAMLRTYLHTMAPRLVVLEVHPDVMANDGVESQLLLLSNSKPTWPLFVAALRTANAKVLCTALYATFKAFIDAFQPLQDEPQEKGDNRYITGGYVEKQGGHYAPEPHTPFEERPTHRQMAALKRMIALLEANETPYVMVRVPSSQSLTEALDSREFERQIGTIGTLITPTIAGLDDSTHFYDDDHLNQQGAELLNRWMLSHVITPMLTAQ